MNKFLVSRRFIYFMIIFVTGGVLSLWLFLSLNAHLTLMDILLGTALTISMGIVVGGLFGWFGTKYIFSRFCQ